MDAQHKKKIQVNFVFIKDNMSDVESVVDQLIQREIFSLEQRSDIVKENASSRDTCQKLIDSLIKSGPAAYDHFLTALQETNNTHLVERLNMTTTEKPPSKKASVTSMEEIPKQNEEQDVVQQTKDCHDPPKMADEILNPTEKRQLLELCDTVNRLEESMLQIKEETVKRDGKITEAIANLHDEVKLYREKSVEFAVVNSKLIEKEEQYSTLQNAFIKLKEQLEERRTRLEARNKQNVQQTKRIEELESELRELRQEMINIEQEKNKVLEDFKSLEDTVARQKTELEQLKLEMEKEIENKDNRINILNNDKQDLNQKCTSLSDHADQQRKTIDQLFTVIEELYKLKNKPVNYIPPMPPFCSSGNNQSSKNINYNKNKKF